MYAKLHLVYGLSQHEVEQNRKREKDSLKWNHFAWLESLNDLLSSVIDSAMFFLVFTYEIVAHSMCEKLKCCLANR